MRNNEELERALAGISVKRTERERNNHLVRLEDANCAADLATYLRKEREGLFRPLTGSDEELASTDSGTRHDARRGIALAQNLTDLMDAVILRIFALACRRTEVSEDAVPMAIVATGGYGRRELSPYSDIDITFIPQRDGDPITDRVTREMFTQVMDVCIARCGLQVGYAYRLLEDCERLDHQTTSALLDARLIAGSSRLFIQFEHAFWSGFNPTDFIFAKLEERRKSLEKWGRTPRVVEPQLKEGPGGLRDLQTSVWLAQARAHQVAARVRGERAIGMLVREGHITAGDSAALESAKEFMFRVRNALHAISGSERNDLVITRQESVACALGYVSQPIGISASSNRSAYSSPGASFPDADDPPVERFMADLYQALGTIRRVSDQVLRHIGNSRLILGIGLDCKRREIVPANDALESDDPAWLLWAGEMAQKYGLAWSEGIERAAANLLNMRPVLSDRTQAGQVFTRILSKAGDTYPILQQMSDLGILGWFLPEFGAIWNLIPYDAAHDFTVGQHTLFAIKHLEALMGADGNEELAEMRTLFVELANPQELILAILLHDAGKAFPGRPHSEVSEDLAGSVCQRLGWSPEATANVLFLVRHHLLMAEVSRLRDISLDETIRDFTRTVTDVERLNMLYLLTYADTRAVGEGVWTQVKGRFLSDLWRRAIGVLSEEEPVGYDDVVLARARRRLMKDLSLENLPDEIVTEHAHSMPPHYLLNQSLREIALHINFVRRVREGETVIDFYDEQGATYTVLTVCTHDDPAPGLLAKIAGVLLAADLDVHSAQVLTRVTELDRIALDTLWVDFRGRQLTPGKRREVIADMKMVLSAEKTVQEILAKRRGIRASPPASVEPEPLTVRSVRNDLSDTLTVIEIGQPDKRGAFYRVCDALSRLGWDIRSARVSTWQNEARANFYVSGARSLTDTEARDALATVLPPAVHT